MGSVLLKDGCSIGHMDPFVSEKIGSYLERIKLFLVANAVEDDKKVAVLLTEALFEARHILCCLIWLLRTLLYIARGLSRS